MKSSGLPVIPEKSAVWEKASGMPIVARGSPRSKLDSNSNFGIDRVTLHPPRPFTMASNRSASRELSNASN
jgi:hypothetical protein